MRLAPLLPLVLCSVAHATPTLPPPLGLGGECRALLSCPWSGSSAANFRFDLALWSGQAGDPRPVSVLPSGALSFSLRRWIEVGAAFTGRIGAATDGGPPVLSYPPTLWARVTPQIGDTVDVGAEVRYAAGRGPLDAGGAAFADSQSYALMLGMRRPRVDLWATLAYQEAAERSYRGLEAGIGLWAVVWRRLGLEVGTEALGRMGGPPGEFQWVGLAGVRFATDSEGVSGLFGYQWAGGRNLPAHGPVASFGLRFGPGYNWPTAPAFEPLLPALEQWIAQRLTQPPALGPRAQQLARALPPLSPAAAFCQAPRPSWASMRACRMALDQLLSPPDKILSDSIAMARENSLGDWTDFVAAAAAFKLEEMRRNLRPVAENLASAVLTGLNTFPAPIWSAAGVVRRRPMTVEMAQRDGRRRFTKGELRGAVDRGKQQGGKPVCEECGVPTEAPHGDHIDAWSRGGRTTPGNLEILCPECNLAKGNHDTVPWTLNPVDTRTPTVPKK